MIKHEDDNYKVIMVNNIVLVKIFVINIIIIIIILLFT